MAQNDTEFPTELRGYKRSEVDAAVSALRGDLIQAAKERQGALEEVTELKNQLASLGGGDAAVTYASLGARLESILRIAEEQSTSLIGQADINAEKMIALAKLEAHTVVETAAREAERLSQDASNESATMLDGARSESEKLIHNATTEAERVRHEALDEAATIRGAVATESAKARTSARRETAALRAESKRAIAEATVVAERERNAAKAALAELEQDIAAERASHELTLKAITQEAELAKTTMEKNIAETTARLALQNENQAEALARKASEARADLEVELSARRSEAEKDLLESHQKAVEMNDRYLAVSTTQLAELKSRVAELRQDHKKIIAAIDASNTSGKTAAAKEAANTIASAHKRATEMVHAAEKEAMERVAAAEARLIELSAERDTIASYVESLRTIVGGVIASEKKKAKATSRNSSAVGK